MGHYTYLLHSSERVIAFKDRCTWNRVNEPRKKKTLIFFSLSSRCFFALFVLCFASSVSRFCFFFFFFFCFIRLIVLLIQPYPIVFIYSCIRQKELSCNPSLDSSVFNGFSCMDSLLMIRSWSSFYLGFYQLYFVPNQESLTLTFLWK